MAQFKLPWKWILGGVAVIGVGAAISSSKKKGLRADMAIPPEDPHEPPPDETPDETPEPEEPMDYAILDRIAEGTAKLDPKKAYKKKRDMKLVNSLVLHQMAFSRGDNPAKYYGVNAHFIILPNGQIVQLQELDRNLKASNGFNKFAVSVEFAGNLPNHKGQYYKPEKFGKDQLTEEQVLAGRYLIDYLIDLMPKYGGAGLQGVYAHRQSSAMRGGDPGPDIWYNVGEWADKHRGLYTGADDGYKIGDGKAIPDVWRVPRDFPNA